MANSSQSILKQTLAPVALVIVFWIAMSGTTTYYLRWIEKSNQRVFVENVVSVRAAEALQIAIWTIVAQHPIVSDQLMEFHTRWNASKAEIIKQRQQLADSAVAEEERIELAQLDNALSQFFDSFDNLFTFKSDATQSDAQRSLVVERQQALELADRVADSAKALFEYNQTVVDQYRLQRQRLNSQVLTVRWTMLAIGPLMGVILGWRLGLRLHRSIARISVTLHDAGSISDSEIGTVAIESSGDFDDVEHQAERVAERMRNVSHELHSARREVLQSERLAAVGELAAGVAHEIRNPLTSVKLLLQHAFRNSSAPTLDESKVRLILEEIGRMETTIQGLLDFSRPPKLNRVRHDLRQTLRRALNLLDARAQQQGIEIDVRMSETPLMVDGDTEKLHQLLVNLLINAVEAMPDGGRLSIEAATVFKEKSIGTYSAFRDSHDETADCMAQIIIRDTGEGISKDLLPRLFEPFATNKERGTGLGLAVSRRIAEEHCGTIRACNGLQSGATFTVTIPSVDVKQLASSN